jgi:hypothetical protein
MAWKLCQLCRRPEPRSCEGKITTYDDDDVLALLPVLFLLY